MPYIEGRVLCVTPCPSIFLEIGLDFSDEGVNGDTLEEVEI